VRPKASSTSCLNLLHSSTLPLWVTAKQRVVKLQDMSLSKAQMTMEGKLWEWEEEGFKTTAKNTTRSHIVAVSYRLLNGIW